MHLIEIHIPVYIFCLHGFVHALMIRMRILYLYYLYNNNAIKNQYYVVFFFFFAV